MSLVLNIWLDSTGITQTFFNWSITVKLDLPNNIVRRPSVSVGIVIACVFDDTSQRGAHVDLELSINSGGHFSCAIPI